MGDVTKKSGKDELWAAVQKWQKRAGESESRRRSLEDTASELQTRLEGLQMQVELYKEKEKENTAMRASDRQQAEKQLADAVEALQRKAEEDAADMKQRIVVLSRENETLQAAYGAAAAPGPASASAASDLADLAAGRDVERLIAAVQEKDRLLREARGSVEEHQARFANLMTSHEAFVNQNRRELEAEIGERLETLQGELQRERTRWAQERDAMVHAHIQQVEELQAAYDEMKEGLESSHAWNLKDKESRRLKAELAQVSDDYNALSERVGQLKQLTHDLEERDALVARLQEQVLEAQSDVEDTRALCVQALRQGAARSVFGLSPSNASMVSGSGTSSSSGSTTSPPPSPKDRPSDLVDLAVSGRAKAKRTDEASAQLARYKNKIKAQEQARQRNVDEVEAYRADYVHALLTELDQLRRSVDKGNEAGETADEVVQLRGSFQREREAWEEEKLRLEDELKRANASPPAPAPETAEAQQAAATEELLEAQLKAAELEVQLDESSGTLRGLEKQRDESLEQLKAAKTQLASLQEVEQQLKAAEAQAAAQQAAAEAARAEAEALRKEAAAVTPAASSAAPAPPPPSAVPDAQRLEEERKQKLAAMREKFRNVKLNHDL